MDFVKELRAKAKAAGKRIVLCEGEDKRVVEAASLIVKEGIAKITLLGNEADIKKNDDMNIFDKYDNLNKGNWSS